MSGELFNVPGEHGPGTIVESAEDSIPSPNIREWISVLVFIAALFLFDLATYNYYPAVWCDEVLFSEPAINRVQHGSFITTVWEFQPANTFPVVNCPLYSLALIPWLAVTGTSLLAVRSFNYALMALATFLLWIASWRFGIVKSLKARVLMLGLFHFGYGMSFAFRCSRPDILGLNCLLLLFLALKIRRPSLRYFFLFLLAAATSWIGFQVALFACFACAVGWLLFRRPGLHEIAILSAATAFGAGSLFFFLKLKGVLSYFLPIVFGIMGKHYAHSAHVTFVAALLKVLRTTWSCYFEDFTTLILMVGLFAVLGAGKFRFTTPTHALIRYCLILILAVPALFNLVGHYAFYYSYMVFIPAIFALSAAYSELSLSGKSQRRPRLRFLAFSIMVAGIIVGLPLRIATTLACCHLVSRGEIQRIIGSGIAREDVVFSDYLPFFEVKKAADVVYAPYYSSVLVATPIPGHDFTVEEKQSISVLVIRPQQAGYLTNFFGGSWKPISEPFGDTQDFQQVSRVPFIGNRFAHYGSQPQTERYQLQIFRRVPQERTSGQ